MQVQFCFLYCRYVYFLLYSKEFVQLLKKWKYTRLHNEIQDPTLVKHANLIAGILFASIILENISWHFKHAFGDLPFARNSL